MITFYCSHCQKKLGASEKHAGKDVKCPDCAGRIRAPQGEPAVEIELETEPQAYDLAVDEPIAPEDSPHIPTPSDEEGTASQTDDRSESVDSLLSSFAYPIRGSGKYALLAVVLFIMALDFIAMIPLVSLLLLVLGIISVLFSRLFGQDYCPFCGRGR